MTAEPTSQAAIHPLLPGSQSAPAWQQKIIFLDSSEPGLHAADDVFPTAIEQVIPRVVVASHTLMSLEFRPGTHVSRIFHEVPRLFRPAVPLTGHSSLISPVILKEHYSEDSPEGVLPPDEKTVFQGIQATPVSG